MKYTINKTYFETIDSEDKAYFLGLLYADGCVHKERNRIAIKLQETDRYILDKFRQFLEYNKPLTVRKYSNVKNTYQDQYLLAIDSKEIKESLVNIGCIPDKSQVIRIPVIDSELIHHFIRGYFDGDGCILTDKKGNKRFSITSNYEFLQQIQDILIKNCSLSNVKICKTRNVYCLHYGGNKSCDKIYNFLYKNSTIFLERKKSKFNE